MAATGLAAVAHWQYWGQALVLEDCRRVIDDSEVKWCAPGVSDFRIKVPAKM